MYDQSLSPTFVRQFRKLPKDIQGRIRSALNELKIDPFTRRPGMAIRRLVGFNRKRWRVRIGDYRIIYQMDGNVISVIEVFPRGRGYRYEIF